MGRGRVRGGSGRWGDATVATLATTVLDTLERSRDDGDR
jgi:hypothetical protein